MKPLAAFLFATLMISNGLAASPTVIIDTTFQEADADGRPLTATAPVDIGELPLRMPTDVDEQPSAATSPSQARVGKEDFGRLKPPYLILQAGENPTEPGAIADVGVYWDLQKLGLSEGHYEISWDMAASQTDKMGGAFRLNIRAQTPNFLAGIHPLAVPGGVLFLKNGQMAVTGNEKNGETAGPVLSPYQADELYHCVLRVDLDKRTWSCEINGDSLVQEQKLPAPFQEDAAAAITLSGMSFGSQRGMGCEADARFLLANVKVTRLAN